MLFAYLPVAHSVQMDWPVLALNVPKGHIRHAPALLFETYEPALQALQSPEPAGAYLPAMQSEHVVEPVEDA